MARPRPDGVLSELERRHSWLRVVRNEEPRLHRVVQPRGGGGDRRRPRLPERRHDPAARLAAPSCAPSARGAMPARSVGGWSIPTAGSRRRAASSSATARARTSGATTSSPTRRSTRTCAPSTTARARCSRRRATCFARSAASTRSIAPRTTRTRTTASLCGTRGRSTTSPNRWSCTSRARRRGRTRNAGAKRHQVKNRQTFRAKWRGTLASLPEAPTRYSGLVCSARVGRSRPMSALPRRARARLRSAAAGVRPRERLEAHLPPGRVPARRRLARGVRLRERAAGVTPSAAPAPARDRDLRRVRRAHAGADRGRRLRPRAVRVLAARREARGAVRRLSPGTRVVVDSVDLHWLRNARRAFGGNGTSASSTATSRAS